MKTYKLYVVLLSALMTFASFASFLTAAKEPSSLGDADDNGYVNAADAALVLVKAAEIGAGYTPTIQEIALLDVNRDGTIDAADATLMLTYASMVGSTENPPSFVEYVSPHPITDYSFEELLAMPEEEIRAISEEVDRHYGGAVLLSGMDSLTYHLHFYSIEKICSYYEEDNAIVDKKKLLDLIGLPDGMVTFNDYDDVPYLDKWYTGSEYFPSIRIKVDLTMYPEYDMRKVAQIVHVLISTNPDIPEYLQSYRVGG